MSPTDIATLIGFILGLCVGCAWTAFLFISLEIRRLYRARKSMLHAYRTHNEV